MAAVYPGYFQLSVGDFGSGWYSRDICTEHPLEIPELLVLGINLDVSKLSSLKQHWQLYTFQFTLISQSRFQDAGLRRAARRLQWQLLFLFSFHTTSEISTRMHDTEH